MVNLKKSYYIVFSNKIRIKGLIQRFPSQGAHSARHWPPTSGTRCRRTGPRSLATVRRDEPKHATYPKTLSYTFLIISYIFFAFFQFFLNLKFRDLKKMLRRCWPNGDFLDPISMFILSSRRSRYITQKFNLWAWGRAVGRSRRSAHKEPGATDAPAECPRPGRRWCLLSPADDVLVSRWYPQSVTHSYPIAMDPISRFTFFANYHPQWGNFIKIKNF